MDRNRRFYRLEIPLLEGDYGRSAKEVLETCALLAEYAQEHTPDQVKAFQEKVKINPQVWLRLLALHRDGRLKKHLKHLPASYTALYAIHRMKDEEIDAAVQQGVITPSASSHAILSWSKQNRVKRGEAVPPWRCLIVFEQQIEDIEFARMRHRMNQIAREYGARLTSEMDYMHFQPKEINKKKDLIGELDAKIRMLAGPVFESMTDLDRSKAKIFTLDDFIGASPRNLSSRHFRIVKGDDSSQRTYCPQYVYRIAREFLKTDSRSQRFNCKHRLRMLIESNPELKELIDEVLETYMS